MFYRYDRNQLIYRKDKSVFKLFGIISVLLIVVSFFFGRYAKIELLEDYEKELIVLNLREEQSKFTEEKLIFLLKELNVKFHIS